MSLLLVILVLLILSLAAIFIGARGDAIDDHPLCRKCGFDLTGKPETSTRCPECGADLSHPSAIRIGHRKRRNKTLTLGIFVALLAACGLAVSIALTHSANWRTYAPVWWLAHEAAGSDGITRDAALQELLIRLGNKNLTDTQTDRLLEQALVFQKDVSKSWDPLWGGFVENANTAGKASAAQWNRYCQQAIHITLSVRSIIGSNDPLPASIEYHPLRVAANSRLAAIAYQRKGNTPPPRTLAQGFFENYLTDIHGGSGIALLDPKELMPLTPGPHTVELTFGAIMGLQGRSAAKPLDPFTVSAPVTILPPGQLSVAVTSDPTLRKQVEQSISLLAGPDPNTSMIEFLIRKPPTGVAFDAYLQLGDREEMLGSLAIPAGKTLRTSFHNPLYLHASDADARIILRPSLNAALKTLDVFQLWNGEVVLNNPPVTRPDPPATSGPPHR